MNNKQELNLRKAIWKELKRFIKVGMDIQLLESGPEIFYNSGELSLTLEKIMSLSREANK